MTPEVEKQNKEFAKWFEDWIAGTRHSRFSVGHIPPEQSASAIEQKNPYDVEKSALVSK
jgi:hypothetical protein